MNAEKLRHSMPCHRVKTVGYFFGSVLNLIVPSTCRSTSESRVIAPVRKVPPAGTTTCPPPALLQAVMAAANAAVLSVLPSPLPPNVVMSKFWSANFGGLIRARMVGTMSQGEPDGVAAGTASPLGLVVNA